MKNSTPRNPDLQALTKIVGGAPALLRTIEQVPVVARSEASVLISGETGTGKELVACAIHSLSLRSAGPFVTVNCGSFADTLLEDEFFGHERGAFTSGNWGRTGVIAGADSGTLFLDEVDTLPPKAQVALLRVLQDKKYRAVGSSEEHVADVRFLAATNAPLDQLVRAGKFRADLLYRLCVFSIHLPPLRERKEDIPLLAAHFLIKHAPLERGPLRLTTEAQAMLLSQDWPGNVRELENTILRGICLSQGQCIEPSHLTLTLSLDASAQPAATTSNGPRSFKSLKQEVIDSFERHYLIRLLRENAGNVTRAALAAGKERRDFGKLLNKHRLDPKNFRSHLISSLL
jgi:DNA-binding NtrC family response regulator